MNLITTRDDIPLNVILVLDDESRKKIKVNLSDLEAYKVTIVYSLSEITEDILENTHKVILLEDYIVDPKHISDLKLYKNILNLDYYYLGQQATTLKFMERYAKCYRLDISVLDYERLYAVVMNDTSTLSNFMLKDEELINDNVELANEFLEDRDTSLESKVLAGAYLTLNEIVSDLDGLLNVSESKLEDIQRDYLAETSMVSKLMKAHNDMLKKSRRLNRALVQYESILTKDIYSKVSLSWYKSRPFVIYLKEYKELIHLNSFLSTLYETIKVQCKLSCKVLKLYDSSASKRILSIPNFYKVVRNKYTASDILVNDFVIKYGAYDKVLDLILSNKVRLDILILVDCKDHSDFITIGPDLVFNMCRNEKDKKIYELGDENTIVNNSRYNGELSWDTYDEFDELEGQDKLLFLSSRSVIQNVIKALEIKRDGM